MTTKSKRELTVADQFSLSVAREQPATEKLALPAMLTRRNEQILTNALENAQIEHLYKELADQAGGDITELASVIASDAHQIHGYTNDLLEQAKSRTQYDLTAKFLGSLLLPAYARAEITLFGRASGKMTDVAVASIEPRGPRNLSFWERVKGRIENG